MRRLSKPLVAVVSGLALLFLSAVPSAATTGTVNSGTLSVNLIPALSVNMAPGTGPCPGNPPATTLDVVMSSATAGTATLTINDAVFAYSGANYFLDGISATAPVTISGSTVSTGTFTTAPGGNIYAATTPTSCTISATTKCGSVGLAGAGDLGPYLSLSGSWSGTVTPPSLSGTAIVSGSGKVKAVGCTAPFAALNQRTLSIASMNVTF